MVALVDRIAARAHHLQHQLAAHPPVVSLRELLRRSRLVIEAASAEFAEDVVCHALAAHRDVLLMSAGGLLINRKRWQRIAASSRGHLYVPSGGLGGLDGVKAMAVGMITRMELTTRKPPAALAEAPFVKTRGLQLNRLKQPRVLFEGSPREAIKRFPQNTNVAATMALACLMPGRSHNRRTQTHGNASHRPRPIKMVVRVVADPTIRHNVHELDVHGDCGRMRCRMESAPSTTNPKTSEVAVRSALATLRQLFHPVRIGT